LTQPSHYQSNNIKEVRYKRKAPRALEKSTIIGQRGSKYTVVGVSVIEPTLEYPDMAISLSLSNGASYTYSQVSPTEFDNLVQTLQEWQSIILGIMPDLETKSKAIKEQRAIVDAQMAAMEEQMSKMRLMQQQAAVMATMIPPEAQE